MGKFHQPYHRRASIRLHSEGFPSIGGCCSGQTASARAASHNLNVLFFRALSNIEKSILERVFPGDGEGLVGSALT